MEDVKFGLETYNNREMTRLEKKQFNEKLIDVHNEKMDCLYSLMTGCKDLNDMINTIETLFNNEIPRSKVVLLSTIHRAKGLEAKTVFFLEPGMIPHPMAKMEQEKEQEWNLKFVAEWDRDWETEQL